ARNVREAFDRLFAQKEPGLPPGPKPPASFGPAFEDPDAAAARVAASIFLKRLASSGNEEGDVSALTRRLRAAADASLNPHRALSFAARVASSLDKASAQETVDAFEIESLIRVCGASEFFGEIIAGNPALIHALTADAEVVCRRDCFRELSAGVTLQESFGAELEALRRPWFRLLVEIGARDAMGELELRDLNRLLTELAVASINVALLIAQREFARRYEQLAASPRLAVLGLGRLGSGGMDYGSDLDVVIVYDSAAPSPVARLTHEEVYARLAELMIAALSNITRSGSLYRVDLRLRPDGQKGLLVTGSEAFIAYLQNRADLWEWLAHVKLRAVAGDLEFGGTIEMAARKSIHEMAQRTDPDRLGAETRRVRDRLEKEKAGRRDADLDIKYGAGGMLDIYFAARYLQLRDSVQDDIDDRTTTATLGRLRTTGSLNEADFLALAGGYALLRAVDHQLRLILGRSARLPAPAHPAFRDIARRLGYVAAAELTKELNLRMREIRGAYERIMQSEVDRNGN
ncbi:MAG TPA: hypothetical protein VLQ90_06775, partial [Pyrinomonadaceae bacterium]|nr:hypothetical protein [Pyrinomonadaceae bacterium]